MVPLFKVAVDKEKILKELGPVLDSGWIGEGYKVYQVEDVFHNHLGSKVKPLAVSSCTAALTIAYRLAGVKPGSLVATTPTTCSATNIPILNLGATPVWVDCDPITGNMDPEALDRVLKKHPEIQAIAVVHWGGASVAIEAIERVAKGRPIIEDCAHCFSSHYKNGLKVGNSNNLCCFSCQAIKFWTSSDGGFLVCPTNKERGRARLLRWYGLDRQSRRMDQDLFEDGYKANMCDTDAAMLIANYELACRNCETHKAHAKLLHTLCPKVFPAYNKDSSSWLSTAIVNDPLEVQRVLEEAGFASDQVHKRNDSMALFKQKALCPFALKGVDEFYSKMLAVPGGWWVTEEEIRKLAAILNEFQT